MKSEGIDHALIVVKDMDRAVEFLSKLFEMDFEEVPWARERFGMRVSFSLPNGQLELFSIVDPIKAAEVPFPFREVAEFAMRGGEGLCKLCLRVKDAEEAIDDAKRKGVRVGYMVEEKKVGPFLNFKEVLFNEQDIPVKGIYLIAYYPPDKITHDHGIFKID